MKIRKIVFNAVAALAVLAAVPAAQAAEQARDVCPGAYVVYPEASHVVYPDGICAF